MRQPGVRAVATALRARPSGERALRSGELRSVVGWLLTPPFATWTLLVEEVCPKAERHRSGQQFPSVPLDEVVPSLASDDVIWFPEDLRQTKGLTVESVLEELSLPEPDEEDVERWWWIDPEDDRAAWEVEVNEAEVIDWQSIPRTECVACGWEAPALLVKNKLCRYCRCKTCGMVQSLGSTLERKYGLPTWLYNVVRYEVVELLHGLESWCLPCMVGHLCVICGAGPKVSDGRCDTCRKYRARTGIDRPERLRQRTPPLLHRLTTLLDPERLAREAASSERHAHLSAASPLNLEKLLDRPDFRSDDSVFWR